VAFGYGKRNVRHALNAQPILSDANCTMVCIFMSVILLASSLIYFSHNEGKEAFEKAAGMEDDCCEDDACEEKQ
jgi:hypothetical protein